MSASVETSIGVGSAGFLISMLFASDKPLELESLDVPLVEVGDGSDFGDTEPLVVPFSFRIRNLCSPFCCIVGIAPVLADFEHPFEQYGLYLSFPLLFFVLLLPQWLHVFGVAAGFSGDDVLRRLLGGSSELSVYR